MKNKLLIILLIVIITLGGYIYYMINKPKEEVQEVMDTKLAYNSFVRVPSSEVEVVKISFYRSDGTIFSTNYIKYKKIKFCTAVIGTEIDCDIFEKFKNYRKIGKNYE